MPSGQTEPTRVVVTGLGPVSSIGIGVSAFADALAAGRSGVSAIRSFDTTGFPYVHAGEVHEFRPESLLRRLGAGWGRASLLAGAAARLAADDAGLPLDALGDIRAGAVIGTTSGESQSVEQLTAQAVAGGIATMSRDIGRQIPANRLSSAVNTELGIHGESVTIGTACSASNYAIGYAFDRLVAGGADVMIAGGADAVCRWAHAGFYRLGALTERTCRPFDRDRDGILTAEGGVCLVLETLEHARRRDARVYAELRGYGLNCDAKHPVAPDALSMADCMRLAHRDAGIEPGEVDYICAHGTGTPANDLAEVRAVHEVFGSRVPPISSIKSMIGHTMGAASGFGAVACVLAICRGFLPPTINLACIDPALQPIDPVPNAARAAEVRIAQNNGYAFGGNNAITIFGAPPCPH
ncbi:beta-ketoacyl-[acyl-carrier-protein] synthase family protein [Nocardia sp. NPDC051321]|uniref:beta-ketoacyl-[acyl-carrier-protein] synthase family protein n=1 Tax=Nocardia sp. NPDC051321 TaxID=3364323 RepID=UPI0037980B70